MTDIDINELIGIIDFNNKETLLKLIEFTRNAAYGYGIVNILEHFLEQETEGI